MTTPRFQLTPKLIVPFLCIVNVAIHLSAINYMEFHRDELLYFSLSNHLDLGYASVPPMISWLAWIAKSLFGFSPFAVKIFPALLSGIFIYIAAQIAKELGGGNFAQIMTAIVLMCTPLSLRAFILFQPVPFDIFFWTLTFYFVIKYLNFQETKWLYYIGITLGLALLNKYMILFLIISLLIALLASRHRNLLIKRAFYLSMFLTLIIASPNIIWQLINDFPVLTHMAELERTQLQFVNKWDFIIGQVTMMLGGILFAIAGLMSLLTKSKFRVLALTCLLVLVILFSLNAKAYYAAGIYPLLIAGGVTWFSSTITSKAFRIGLISFYILITLPFLPFGIPFLKPDQLHQYFDFLASIGLEVGRTHEDGDVHPLPQDYADMLGWYDIARYAKIAYEQAENPKTTIIYGENYGIAGAVSLINKKHGLPEAISFSDTYAYWAPESFDPDIETLIYINDNLGANVKALFEDITLIGEITDPLSRQLGVKIYLCESPRRSFNDFWSEVLASVRSE